MDENLNGDVSDCDLFSDDDDVVDPTFVPQDVSSSSSDEDENTQTSSQTSTPSRSPTARQTSVSKTSSQLQIQTFPGPSNVSLPIRTSQEKRSSAKESFRSTEPSSPASVTTSTRRTYWKNVATGEFNPLPLAPRYEDSIPIGIDLQPQDYFHKYIPNDLIQKLTEHTNQRYIRDTGRNLSLTDTETTTFLGLTIVMSYLKYPRIRMYWAEKTRVPVIADNMSRDRYFTIRKNLKLRDDLLVSDEERAEDKFWKVRPLLKSIETACLLNEKSSNVAVDEQMIPFFGHAPARQYVKGKPNPCGLKCFIATSPDGLPLDFFVYAGQGDRINADFDPEVKDLDIGGRVVIRLSKYLPPGCTLYMDRYFTSIQLLDVLHTKAHCQATGTLRKSNIPSNIGFKSDAEMRKLGRGSVDEKVRNDGQICVLKWFDNKPVVLASSVEGKEPEDICRRWSKKDKVYIPVNRPVAVKNYNSFMGGVDLLDRVISYYRISARTKKWTIRVMMHFLDFAVAAGWIEYRRHQHALNTPKKDVLDYLGFRMDLADYLIYKSVEEQDTSEYEPSESSPKKVRYNAKTPLPSAHLRTKNVLHLPEIPTPPSKNRCRMPGCKANSARIRCAACKVYLCLQEDRQCFKLFHEI